MLKKLNLSQRQKSGLRLWLELLSLSNSIRKALHARLVEKYDMGLSRFDIMAGLERAGKDGIRLGPLSKLLKVSGGNVTQVIKPLIDAGFVIREVEPHDRRAAKARLSEAGEALFYEMATDHAAWLEDLLAPLEADQQDLMLAMLKELAPDEDEENDS